MPSTCPICEQPIPPTAAHCPVCGFPTALAIEALRAVRAAPTADGRPGPSNGGADGAPAKSRPPPPPEAELSAALGRGLRERMEALRPLGRDAPDVTSEMCEAALGEASGRVSEALETLRAAQGRLERQAREALRRRVESLDERRAALERTGIHLDLEMELPSAESLAGSGTPLAPLLEAEQRLAKFESDWKGIQGLLAQIETLRAEVADLGFPLGEIPAEVQAIRQKLSAGPLRGTDLDALAQDAARALMLLHDEIPTSLGDELARHATTLAALPDETDEVLRAREIHEEAARHIEKGRLTAAAQSLRDLRRAVAELERRPATPAPTSPPAAAAPAAAPPPPAAAALPDAALLDTLLKKARSLAARVRTLPPESPLALEAAAQIREATDLLRGGRLPDADRTLTELMRTLSREEGRR
ncbi:MAG TPA: hypothetical protein VMG36_07485 [Thermoplasmata archaeon]|nr:hypothetical protein [Thermoplasmata archaeon]